VSTEPRRWCIHDRCHEFVPGSHNAAYCPDCKCKRKQEAARKRLTEPITDDVALWELQENRKIGRIESSQAKNEWLLEKSTFAFFDLETSNLDASIGFIICGAVGDRHGEKEVFVAQKNEEGLFDDHESCVVMRDRLESFDYVVTFYGTGFDIPYINTRLVMNNERPIDRLRHIDMYYVARHRLKLHSNRLQVVSETLFGDSNKTRVIGPIWTKALMGDVESLNYITEHCLVDIDELRAVFEKLRGFVNLSAVRWRKYGGSY